MSCSSSLRASRARTIGNASRAGRRFAEQASWLRTSTSGSIAARRASARATGVRHLRCIAQEPGCPEPHVGVGMFERIQGDGFVELPDGVQVPRGPRARSDRSFSASIRTSSGATAGSLRSAISRWAVCSRPLVGIDQGASPDRAVVS